jgi:hypothetical protein
MTLRLDEALNFRAADCNAGDHKLYATTVHQLSAPGPLTAALSGSKATTAEAECKRGALTVTLEPPTITTSNEYSGVRITNMPPDCVPGVRSSNPGVATVQEFGSGMWLAYGVGAGTTTITATCSSNNATGSATLTVTAPRQDNPDRWERSQGGGADASDCPDESTYYHMRWNYGRGEYEWTGGVVCLPGETRSIIYLGW